MIRVLDRACMREASFNFLFYGLGYLGLVSVLVCVPFIKQGAPPLAVLAFLPDNLLFISMLALPLAMVTALLATVGRMREDGEITALMAAGISSWRIALALLPLAVALALVLGLGAHLVLPGVAHRLVVGRADLVNQASATHVTRHQPIYQVNDDIVSAVSVHDDMLSNLFIVHFDRTAAGPEDMTVCFAPEARFVTDPTALSAKEVAALELHHAWVMRAESLKPGAPAVGANAAPVLTGFMPVGSLRLQDFGQNLSDLQDGESTLSLYHKLHTMRITDENRAEVRGYERAWHTRWMIPVAVIIYWAFAVGLGLTLGRNNRLLAVFLAVLIVVATMIPGFGIVKSLGARLYIDAGWLMWPPVLLLAMSASWMLWRQR